MPYWKYLEYSTLYWKYIHLMEIYIIFRELEMDGLYKRKSMSVYSTEEIFLVGSRNVEAKSDHWS